MKTYIVTLGCPKNLVDSEATANVLRHAGCSLTDDPADADLLMVGACSFLDSSWNETVDEVHRLAEFKHGETKRLVLMGCLPRHRNEDLENDLPMVDHFLPTGAHERLADLVSQWRGGEEASRIVAANGANRFAGLVDRELFTPGHTAYVKVAEGCNRKCTFCAIPTIRGRMESRPLADVVAEVGSLVDRGVKEVTLLAQDIIAYRSGSDNFFDLVSAIADTGIDWVRIFYLHPAGMSIDHIRRVFDLDSVCPYLEMPVQHASSSLLASMKRSYDRNHVVGLLRDIRDAYPDAVIRSEVIVGFPGETDSEFDDLKDFVAEMAFDALGVFPFSPEPGTVAASLSGAVAQRTIADRVSELSTVQEAVSFGQRSRFLGRKLDVLVDRVVEVDECYEGCGVAGRFFGQALEIDGEVYVEGTARVGEFVTVEITDTDVFDMRGKVIS